MKAIFRADASQSIGSGHIYRCLSLADMLHKTGWSCAFACTEETLTIVPALATRGYDILPPDADVPCDLLVIDHYELDASYETPARDWASRSVVIDDLADRAHDCDVLLDMTYGRSPRAYEGLTPDEATLLCGSTYALLRPEFAAHRAEALARRHSLQAPPCVLVSLGSTNLGNVTGRVLDGLSGFDRPVHVDVVMGSGAYAYEEVRQIADKNGYTLHTDTQDMARLMVSADIAIGAGGTSSWERCALGLPTLLIELADNQSLIADALDAQGAVFNLGRLEDFNPFHLQNTLRDLFETPSALAAMSAKAASICDGRGLERVHPALLADEIAKNGHTVRLRLMEARDEERLLLWQSEPETRRFARNPAIPSAEEHALWMTRTLEDAGALAYIILMDGLEAGHVRLNNRESHWEISILIDPAYHGMGVALAALNFLHRLHANKLIRAEVLPDNVGSLALFAKAGYKPLGNNWFQHENI
jgi:UDP-2,4-diacetamido-2,4,6-trideoxy-beta-L-altropyranose hydrolase